MYSLATNEALVYVATALSHGYLNETELAPRKCNVRHNQGWGSLTSSQILQL